MNTQTLIIGVLVGAVAGYFLAGLIGAEPTPETALGVFVPDSAIELTKCMPGMGYHYADPETLPRGPIFMRDGDGEVIGIEYLILEEELESGEGPGREFMLDAFEAGFTNVSLAFEANGVGDLPMPLYALHLYAEDEMGRTGVCDGEELEEEHHGDETATGLMVGDNAIAVSEQPPADSVTVSLATLAEDGYIVIHEAEEGAPGAIIAASGLLPAGTHNNVAVDLNAVPTDGSEFIAMLHTDNGDGQFNAADDAPVTHDGGPIMMSFVIDSNAEVPAAVSI